MRHFGVVLVHQHLRDDGGGAAVNTFPAEQLAGNPLDHVAHAALRIGDAGVQGKARHPPLPFFHADQDVADLRAVAVNNRQVRIAAEQWQKMLERLAGVRELLGNCAGFAGPGDGVATQRDYQSLGHSATARIRFPCRPW